MAEWDRFRVLGWIWVSSDGKVRDYEGSIGVCWDLRLGCGGAGKD